MVSDKLVVLIVVDLGEDDAVDHGDTVQQAVVRLRDLVQSQVGEPIGHGEIVGAWVGHNTIAERVIQVSMVKLAR